MHTSHVSLRSTTTPSSPPCPFHCSGHTHYRPWILPRSRIPFTATSVLTLIIPHQSTACPWYTVPSLPRALNFRYRCPSIMSVFPLLLLFIACNISTSLPVSLPWPGQVICTVLCLQFNSIQSWVDRINLITAQLLMLRWYKNVNSSPPSVPWYIYCPLIRSFQHVTITSPQALTMSPATFLPHKAQGLSHVQLQLWFTTINPLYSFIFTAHYFNVAEIIQLTYDNFIIIHPPPCTTYLFDSQTLQLTFYSDC